jgi:protein TonB
MASSTTAKGYLCSLLAHAGAFALCLAGSGWMVVPAARPHYGSRAQRAIEVSFYVPAPARATEVEPPQIEVVISPQHARMGDRSFVYVPAAETAAPVMAPSHSEEVPKPVLPRRTTDTTRDEAISASPTEQPRAASRRAAAAMPSIAEVPLPLPPIRFIGNVPRYPAEALAQNWEGSVVLLVRIDTEGRVVDVQIETSSGFLAADAEAVRMVRTWRATPQHAGDVLKAGVVRQPVQFRL